MRRFAPAASFRVVIAVGLTLVAVALLLMHGLTTGSHWTALLAGFIVGGIGIGLANPAIAAAALRVVDPARTGMASGVNNAFRLSGVAVGVAALGAVLESRASSSLASSLGPHGRALGQAVASTGTRAAGSRPEAVHAAGLAFVSGLNAVLLVGCIVVAVGAAAAGALMRAPRAVAAAAATSSET
jgi:hypothetical protein